MDLSSVLVEGRKRLLRGSKPNTGRGRSSLQKYYRFATKVEVDKFRFSRRTFPCSYRSKSPA
jgi:hypothetical protein